MKRIAALLLCCLLMLSACGQSAQPTEAESPIPEPQTSAAPVVESVETAAAPSVSDDKILIVYFAVAENSDVDAVSSASVVVGTSDGMSKFIADIIAELEPDATVLQGIAVHQNDVAKCEKDVLKWLDGLGY